MLVMNHEGCGKNCKAGVSLWDVTDPLKPKKLSEHFGDFTVDDQPNRRMTPTRRTARSCGTPATVPTWSRPTTRRPPTSTSSTSPNPKHPVLIASST